jgi:hypothetical protein
MLKIPAEDDRDTSSAIFTGISVQFSPCLAATSLLVFDRELWLTIQEGQEHRWQLTIDQIMTAVHGMLSTIPPHNSKQ